MLILFACSHALIFLFGFFAASWRRAGYDTFDKALPDLKGLLLLADDHIRARQLIRPCRRSRGVACNFQHRTIRNGFLPDKTL